jgi:pSer/pThr/pTyr-binding forkhead associated (FHA) protein
MAKVFLKFESAVIKEIVLTKDEITFGRKPNNDIVIDHPTVSGFHGKIVKAGDTYTVQDLKSTNGTFINGHRIEQGLLKNRDQIGVARHILEFVMDDAVAASTGAPPSDEAIKVATEMKYQDIIKQAYEAEVSNEKKAGDPAPVSAKKEKEPAELDENGLPPLVATVRIISGAADKNTDIKLTDLTTYIGTSPKANIKITGFLAPDLAAAISKRPEGYFLRAVKSGYPKVNGNPIKEQALLDNGTLIEVGGTNMVFYLKDPMDTNGEAR